MTVLLGILEVVIGVIIAELLMEHVIKPLLSKKPDIACDSCNQVRFLTLTPDEKHWLCDECMAAYMLENGNDLIDNAK
jgi:hypothetical protein